MTRPAPDQPRRLTSSCGCLLMLALALTLIGAGLWVGMRGRP